MKKAIFLTMFAAALLGGQVFAYIPTVISGSEYDADAKYYGKYSGTGDVSGGSISIGESQQGADMSGATVYGCGTTAESASASNSVLTMSGGQVSKIYGGTAGAGGAVIGNTVIVTGGKAASIYAGQVTKGEISGNRIFVTGVDGESTPNISMGGASIMNDNVLHLIGAGASVSTEYGKLEGSAMRLGNIILTSILSERSGNTLNIYGSNITATYLQLVQRLNFHLNPGLPTETSPMLTLTTESEIQALNLGTLESGIEVYGDAVEDWSAFEGRSITLVQTNVAIKGFEQAAVVNITSAAGAVLATATLDISNDLKQLNLIDIKAVPEPTTGSLSLLALAGLAARRRRK